MTELQQLRDDLDKAIQDQIDQATKDADYIQSLEEQMDRLSIEIQRLRTHALLLDSTMRLIRRKYVRSAWSARRRLRKVGQDGFTIQLETEADRWRSLIKDINKLKEEIDHVQSKSTG